MQPLNWGLVNLSDDFQKTSAKDRDLLPSFQDILELQKEYWYEVNPVFFEELSNAIRKMASEGLSQEDIAYVFPYQHIMSRDENFGKFLETYADSLGYVIKNFHYNVKSVPRSTILLNPDDFKMDPISGHFEITHTEHLTGNILISPPKYVPDCIMLGFTVILGM